MLEKIMQQIWKMTPTWRQNGGLNPLKIHEKQYTKTPRKMMRPKAMGPEGPTARSAGKR